MVVLRRSRGAVKSFMTREGVFDELDIALAPHPSDSSNVVMGTLANIQAEFRFTGAAAHAAAAPERGRSALDAADLMIVGTQFLREHIVQEARLHHAYLDAGGSSPNVVQASAALLFYIRAPKSSQVREIYQRVQDIARGAALMTGTTVEIAIKSAMVEVVPNDTLGKLLVETWQEIGPCPFSAEARAFAARMAPAVGNTTGENLLDETVPTYRPEAPTVASGSSDVGDVSFKVPTVMAFYASMCKGTPGHSWQFASQAATPLMHDAMIHFSKVMACTVLKLLENPALVQEAKDELKKRGVVYDCLIPAEVKPEI